MTDATGALIPGAEVTARQTDTGIDVLAVSNETGTYRFVSLRPGPYEVSATLPGFQTQTFQMTLGSGQQRQQNIVLQVGTVATAVEVTVAADELLTSTLQSVADTLDSDEVFNLPIVGRNVTAIATRTTAGVIGTGNSGTTFAGISAQGSRSVNVQVDGMTVNNGRHEQGLATATSINPDMVAEVRIVVAAVDVETPGSAQFQVRTKSGTNEFHGALVWNNENSVLNANSWNNNRLENDKDWFNRNQYTASVGGPIVRNKTFFFFLFDGQRALTKQSVNGLVLTEQARQGIFRFFPGVNNGNADAPPTSGSGNTLTAPVVDSAGNPLDWTQIEGATGPMQSFNVFGDALNPGDPFRTGFDPTGFMARLIADMPAANAFDSGAATGGALLTSIGGVPVDGLNTAVHRWTRRVTPGRAGTGGNPANFDREQYNLKIDHDFNTSNRLTGSFIREFRTSTNAGLSPWPNGFNGESTTDPTVYTLSFTSTITPNLLNEFKWGRRVTTLKARTSYHNSDPELAQAALDYLPVINGIPVIPHPELFTNHMINCAGFCTYFGNKSPLTTFGDTLSWTTGSHSLKFGGEVRHQSTYGWSPNLVVPHLNGGAGDTPVTGIDQIPDLLNNNQALAERLLLSLSGSVNDVRQRLEIREASDPEFLDYRGTYDHPDNPDDTFGRIRDWHQNEANFFVKDDWRITPNFTLNLGLRYDLMQVPYLLSASGANYTPGLKGGNRTAFGYSGTDFSGFWSGGTERRGEDTQIVLIGEGGEYPDQGIWGGDRNNWAPALGFAWSPDFWGAGQTTIRGGYQVAYQLPGDSLSWVDVDVGNMPGFVLDLTDSGDGTFRDFSDVEVPIDAAGIKPFQPIPITQRAQTLRVHSENYATPYVQTFTLGVTRSLTQNLTLDVKYIGTKGTKMHETFNMNAPDIRNNGLLNALEVTRAGGDHPLFDRMLNGLNLGSGIVGVDVTGSEAMRLNRSVRNNVANGNFVAVADWLNRTNTGTVQTGAGVISGGLLRSSGEFPENFIVANPQFRNVTLAGNLNNSIYHSLQTQVTLRPTNGISYQATYTWSRSLGLFAQGGAGYRDPSNQRADRTLQTNHRTHGFRSFGTFELPFGPGRLLGGNSSGVLARVIEGWKLGAIVNMTSGDVRNITGGTMVWGTGTLDIVGDFPREGNVVWDGRYGNFFDQSYQSVDDPQCAALADNLKSRCTLNALADASGNIVLQHPEPGQLGGLGLGTIEGPGIWEVDMNIQKSIQIDENKSVSLRMDAQNVFNHATPGNPNLNVNSSTPFGQIGSRSGNRIVQGQIRFDW